MKKTLIVLLSTLLVLINCVSAFGEETSLTELVVLPGVFCDVDLSTGSGEVSLFGADGHLRVVNYEITYNSQGKYIKFEEKNDYSRITTSLLQDKNDISTRGTRGSYFKDEVSRTYPDNYISPTIIYYSEYGPYGYAAGNIRRYAFGININNPDHYDVWYQGFLYYDEGGVVPNSNDEYLD